MSEATIDGTAPETAELLATRIPRKRELVLKRPGNINFVGDKGSFPGARLVLFGGALQDAGGLLLEVAGLEEEDYDNFVVQVEDELKSLERRKTLRPTELVNLYFKHRANLLVLDIESLPSAVRVLFTNQLEDDEVDEFQEASKFLEDHMQAFREKKEAKRREAAEAKAKADAELKELAELGRKEREFNFIGQVRELKEELEKARKELNRAKKKLGEKAGE